MGLRHDDRHRVLVVDDVPATSALVRAMLEHDAHFDIVGEAGDGITAVAMVTRTSADLVVLDLVMPGAEGLAALPELLATAPDLGVVVYSDLVANEDAAFAAGAHAFVRKGSPMTDLKDALVSVAARRAGRAGEDVLGGADEFRSLVLDSMREGLVAQDESGRIVFANPAARAILGLQTDEILGLTSMGSQCGTVHPDGTPFPGKQHPGMVALRTGATVPDVVMGVRRPDGVRRWLSVSATPIVGDSGRPRGVVSTFIDVTERFEGERARAESETRFRSAVESMLDGFLVFRSLRNDDGDIVDFRCEFANEAIEANTGWKVDEVVGRSLLELAPALGGSPAFDACVSAVESDAPLEREVPYEGTRVTGAFEIRGRKLGDGLAITYRNITERKRTEEALKDSEERVRQVLEAMSVGVGVLDPAGLPVFLNGAGRAILGRGGALPGTDLDGLSEFLGIRRATTGEPYPVDELPLTVALRHGKSASADDVVIDRDGTPVPLQTYAAPVMDADGRVRYAVTVFSDISDRRAQEARLGDALAELAEVNEELGEFAAAAAHDLAAPLRAISGFAELLDRRHGASLDPESREWIGFMLAEADRMRSFIDDLLVYAGVGAAAPRPPAQVDLGEVFAAALAALCGDLADTGAEVEVGELPVVEGDSTALLQVAQNLLGNAVKFRRDGTPLRIVVESEPRDRMWRVAVSDNGVGVAEAERTRIFAPFHRDSPGAPGNGLGLSICRRIVERAGGRIWVEPCPDGGSRFVFTAPRPASVNGADAATQ